MKTVQSVQSKTIKQAAGPTYSQLEAEANSVLARAKDLAKNRTLPALAKIGVTLGWDEEGQGEDVVAFHLGGEFCFVGQLIDNDDGIFSNPAYHEEFLKLFPSLEEADAFLSLCTMAQFTG